MRARRLLVFLVCLLFAPTARGQTPLRSATLLDEVGRLTRPVHDSEIAAWKHDLKATDAPAEYAAKLHVLLGEVELARNEQPDRARWNFREAQRLSTKDASNYGLACYDDALALFYSWRLRLPLQSTMIRAGDWMRSRRLVD